MSKTSGLMSVDVCKVSALLGAYSQHSIAADTGADPKMPHPSPSFVDQGETYKAL